MQALAALASLNPVDIGLGNFGPSTDYFPRQIKSLSRVSEVQAQAVDVDTEKTTGKIPLFDELVDWYQSHLPDEMKTGLRVVHGDYKLDNMIFHPSENKVIGILDWELCTLGSPVSHPALSTWLEHKIGSSWQTLAISRNHGRLIPKIYPTTHYSRTTACSKHSRTRQRTYRYRWKTWNVNTVTSPIKHTPSKR